MLSKAFATVNQHGGIVTDGSRSRMRTAIRGIVLLLCLLGLLATTSVFTALAAPPSQDAAVQGDAADGEGLFTGSNRFDGGGPPCLACHSIAGIGALGGGVLGPNLTTTGWKGPALGAFLDLVITDNMADTYPVMNAVWSNEAPLTAQERADVGAFLLSADVTERTAGAIFKLTGLAITGTALLLGIAQLVWLRRTRNVRLTMVGKPTLRSS